LEDYKRWWRSDSTSYPSGGHELNSVLVNSQAGDSSVFEPGEEDAPRKLVRLDRVEGQLTAVYEAGVRTHNSPLLGNARPEADAARGALSEFSGPRPSRRVSEERRFNEPPRPAELRTDDLGRPKMPARNSAYLGRSLFGDYLLPVELAGMLLLVAAIGAIA